MSCRTVGMTCQDHSQCCGNVCGALGRCVSCRSPFEIKSKKNVCLMIRLEDDAEYIRISTISTEA